MNQVLNKIKQSKLSQRILKVGLVYVVLEITIAIAAVFYVAQEAIT
ncbi:hypothetical protein [Shewanella sp. CAL98-MNA-CIBAN-0140]